MRKLFLPLFLLVILFFATGAVAGSYATLTVLSPADAGNPAEKNVHIPAGSGVSAIALILREEGLIKNEIAFLLLTRMLGYEESLREGEYRFSPAMTIWQIIEKLRAGEVVTYRLTVPEGYNVLQIRERMVEAGFDQQALDDVLESYDLVEEWVPQDGRSNMIQPLEGYLFPDTYTYDSSMDERDLVLMMIEQFRRIWTTERLEKLNQAGLSVHEAVTLASIVEKEAMLDEERPLIAAVYRNRAKIGMKLDADPTVLYALGKQPGEALYRNELQVDSPYNTYRYAAMPPGPIASPGAASIDAVLEPEDVPYLYFVSRNDGSHVFATTYREQQQNVARYQP